MCSAQRAHSSQLPWPRPILFCVRPTNAQEQEPTGAEMKGQHPWAPQLAVSRSDSSGSRAGWADGAIAMSLYRTAPSLSHTRATQVRAASNTIAPQGGPTPTKCSYVYVVPTGLTGGSAVAWYGPPAERAHVCAHAWIGWCVAYVRFVSLHVPHPSGPRQLHLFENRVRRGGQSPGHVYYWALPADGLLCGSIEALE